ncbi:hypothetical protein HanHA300_Chr14g0510101 [Helianthus annuus]|uniref:uncharacterized protein LOC118486318 n=1 Tax=Helianthus annuus TaxID=4232 RepID=UPI001652FF2D|nr:uncharacterized protein LOC118486318 [Helianthus annuus]KAJ0462978.1 hypothetical protein HanHA300_Chr14g0510101 [Helianthus annuus]KAJ0484336.1 hypothetical protein HanHA89_Chr14g0543011 [Helianthus annuus]KAJ0654889.1 hypothetical protein HanLR1_Chr14g0512251 [Helianthus annuus]
MDPSMLSYAAYLSGATPFVPPTFGFSQAGGWQPSQQQAEPDVNVVQETQPEPVPEKSKRGRRSHKKKEANKPRRKNTYLNWTKEEEYTLARSWLEVSEDPEIANFQTGHVFWDRVRASFGIRGVKASIGTKIPFLANGPTSTTSVTPSKKCNNVTTIITRAEKVTSGF